MNLFASADLNNSEIISEEDMGLCCSTQKIVGYVTDIEGRYISYSYHIHNG